MNAPNLEGSEWFIGDLGDPWVAALADACPEGVARRWCAGDLTDTWFQGPRPPRTLVLHRTLLTPHDAEVLARYRGSRTPSPQVLLCVGPHIRHADLERWSALVDVMVPEATARDTIARHLSGGDERPRPSGPRPRVRVVSDNFELRAALADACAAAGYPAEPAHEWSEAAPFPPSHSGRLDQSVALPKDLPQRVRFNALRVGTSRSSFWLGAGAGVAGARWLGGSHVTSYGNWFSILTGVTVRCPPRRTSSSPASTTLGWAVLGGGYGSRTVGPTCPVGAATEVDLRKGKGLIQTTHPPRPDEFQQDRAGGSPAPLGARPGPRA